MLKIDNVTLGHRGKPVLRLERLEVPTGGQCLITGASGCGKTTLLHAVAGLLPVLSGTITLQDTTLSALSESARDRFRGRHIGLIFQTLHLVRSLSVIANLRLAFYAAGIGEQAGRANEVLARLGLADKRDALPEELSQGQAQRVAIARAVVHCPSLILADEPTSSLDDASCNAVITLIRDVASESGATLLISTHDQRLRPHFESVVQLEGTA